MTIEIWLFIIGILVGTIAFFLARIVNTTDKIADDVSDMKPKVKVLWEEKFSTAHSPRQLNDLGEKILNESGIKEIVEEKKSILLAAVKKVDPRNPYDAEKVILKVMSNLPEHCPEVIDALKTNAFSIGTNLDVILFVGGIYLRNLIFPDLGFNVDDLDKPKTNQE